MWTVTIGATGGVAASTINQILSLTQAAANYWGRYVDTSLGSIEIQVDISSLGGSTLAQAGTDFFYAYSSGGLDFFEPATIVELTSGIDLNGASPDIPIEIDLASLQGGDFNFGPLVDGVSLGGAFNKFDLWTVLVHEIGHGLGFLSFLDEGGTDRSTFDQYVTQVGGNYFFDGPDPNFGPIPLDSGFSHIANSVDSVLNPSLAPGIAIYLTELDVSVFGDIGAPLKRPTTGDDDLSSFSTDSRLLSVNPALHALQGDDTVIGMPGEDFLFGDEGADSLYGGSGDDQLYGGADDDTLLGDPGADTLFGDAGHDIADYSLSTAGVRVTLAPAGDAGAGYSAGDAWFSIEEVIGSAWNDTLFGHDSADTLRGGPGADSLVGGDGDDSMDGGSGDDFIDGGAGNDSIGGEAGRDRLVSGDGDDTLHGFGSHDTLAGDAGNDDLRGGFGQDLLNGSDGNDILRGFEGDDRLVGGGGLDTLLGNDGDDSLTGGGGVDRLKGDAGNDTLDGSFGADSLTGGIGDDLFEYRLAHGADTITDFVAGAEDAIRLIGFGAAFDDFADVLAAATQVGANVVIDFGAGDTITLQNLTLASLDASDFLFG